MRLTSQETKLRDIIIMLSKDEKKSDIRMKVEEKIAEYVIDSIKRISSNEINIDGKIEKILNTKTNVIQNQISVGNIKIPYDLHYILESENAADRFQNLFDITKEINEQILVEFRQMQLHEFNITNTKNNNLMVNSELIRDIEKGKRRNVNIKSSEKLRNSVENESKLNLQTSQHSNLQTLAQLNRVITSIESRSNVLSNTDVRDARQTIVALCKDYIGGTNYEIVENSENEIIETENETIRIDYMDTIVAENVQMINKINSSKTSVEDKEKNILQEYPVLQAEYNEDGSRKMLDELIKDEENVLQQVEENQLLTKSKNKVKNRVQEAYIPLKFRAFTELNNNLDLLKEVSKRVGIDKLINEYEKVERTYAEKEVELQERKKELDELKERVKIESEQEENGEINKSDVKESDKAIEFFFDKKEDATFGFDRIAQKWFNQAMVVYKENENRLNEKVFFRDFERESHDLSVFRELREDLDKVKEEFDKGEIEEYTQQEIKKKDSERDKDRTKFIDWLVNVKKALDQKKNNKGHDREDDEPIDYAQNPIIDIATPTMLSIPVDKKTKKNKNETKKTVEHNLEDDPIVTGPDNELCSNNKPTEKEPVKQPTKDPDEDEPIYVEPDPVGKSTEKEPVKQPNKNLEGDEPTITEGYALGDEIVDDGKENDISSIPNIDDIDGEIFTIADNGEIIRNNVVSENITPKYTVYDSIDLMKNMLSELKESKISQAEEKYEREMTEANELADRCGISSKAKEIYLEDKKKAARDRLYTLLEEIEDKFDEQASKISKIEKDLEDGKTNKKLSEWTEERNKKLEEYARVKEKREAIENDGTIQQLDRLETQQVKAEIERKSKEAENER